jgi:hypothetical protein
MFHRFGMKPPYKFASNCTPGKSPMHPHSVRVQSCGGVVLLRPKIIEIGAYHLDRGAILYWSEVRMVAKVKSATKGCEWEGAVFTSTAIFIAKIAIHP